MASEAGETTYIVECYWPSVRSEQVEQGAERARRVTEELTREGGPIRFAGSISIPHDEVVFYLFEAQSALLVGEACERAAITFERVARSVWKPATPVRKEEP